VDFYDGGPGSSPCLCMLACVYIEYTRSVDWIDFDCTVKHTTCDCTLLITTTHRHSQGLGRAVWYRLPTEEVPVLSGSRTVPVLQQQ
jgi:hypothetical protein